MDSEGILFTTLAAVLVTIAICITFYHVENRRFAHDLEMKAVLCGPWHEGDK